MHVLLLCRTGPSLLHCECKRTAGCCTRRSMDDLYQLSEARQDSLQEKDERLLVWAYPTHQELESLCCRR
jgi:hypothetical protein